VTALKLGLLKPTDKVDAKMRAALAEAFPAQWMHVVRTGKATGEMTLADVGAVLGTVRIGGDPCR
jgi:photosystem II stability/assembly factor-like uncharacterized protein